MMAVDQPQSGRQPIIDDVSQKRHYKIYLTTNLVEDIQLMIHCNEQSVSTTYFLSGSNNCISMFSGDGGEVRASLP